MKFNIVWPSGHVACKEFDTFEKLLEFIDENYTDMTWHAVRVYPKEEWESVSRIEIFNGHKE